MTLAEQPVVARSARNRRRMTALLLGATLIATGGAVAVTAPAASAADCETVPWMDTTKSADERAQSVLDASTLDQTMRWVVEQPAITPNSTNFGGVVYPEALPCLPTITFSDGPEGVHRVTGITGFPSPLSEASVWDEDLTARKYDAISSEGWANQRALFLAPGIAAQRTPLAARTTSYLSEDPVLSGVLAAAGVRAFQEQDGTPTVATLKHWVGNEQRFGEEEGSSNIDDRTLRQMYNLPYEIAIKEGNPGSIMCSYNMINNIYACEQPLQKSLLKEDNGFDGFIMSDFGGVYSTVPSFLGGMDMELNRPVHYTPAKLHAALDAGEITEEQLDHAAFRVIRSFIANGLFDNPRPAAVNPNASTPEHKALAQEIAEKGSVLLKNEGALPIGSDGPTVAVIGATAANTAGTVCTPFSQVRCPSPVTPLAAIEARVAQDGGSVLYDAGTDLVSAAAAADEADVVVVFGWETTAYGTDRPNLNLDGNSDALIAELASVHDNVVVVLQVGTAVEMPWIDDVESVLNVWYAGERMGPAIAGLLFGDVNPSGKLPMTFPVSVSDTPTGGWGEKPEQFPGVEDENGILQTDYTEGMKVGYRWYEAEGIEPLFEFGHGLSYTTYEYSDLSVARADSDGAEDLQVSFTVTNTGDRVGDEIAQVYVELPESANEPSKRLIAWDRVEGIEPGESRDVQITLTPDQLDARHLLDYWDTEQQEWVTVDEFTVHAGSSVKDLPLSSADPAEPELDLDVTVASRCAAGKNQLTVTTLNTVDVPVALTYESDFGSKSFAAVQPDKNAFHAFTTRLAALPAGDVTVTATATIDGQSVTSTEVVDYATRSCG